MAAKITTPLSVLVLCYLMIIGFVFILLSLAGVMAYDLNFYFKNQKQIKAIGACKRFLEQEQYGLYEQCYNKMIEDVKPQDQ